LAIRYPERHRFYTQWSQNDRFFILAAQKRAIRPSFQNSHFPDLTKRPLFCEAFGGQYLRIAGLQPGELDALNGFHP